MQIVGYTFDADTWCVPCTEARYPELYATDGVLMDSEGNEVCPIFDYDEAGDTPTHCGGCGAFIDDSWGPSTVTYAEDAVRDFLDTGSGNTEVLATWVDNGYPWAGFDEELAERFEEATR